MKDCPILFNDEMVRAILAGRKTQTRMVLNKQPMMVEDNKSAVWNGPGSALQQQLERLGRGCKYGQPGDRLWVRETWAPLTVGFAYRADSVWNDAPPSGKWHPSIRMPRWASRITLEITGVRMQRLNYISEDEAIAEGFVSTAKVYKNCEDYTGKYAIENYKDQWININGDGSWYINPWVWVIEFKKVD